MSWPNTYEVVWERMLFWMKVCNYFFFVKLYTFFIQIIKKEFGHLVSNSDRTIWKLWKKTITQSSQYWNERFSLFSCSVFVSLLQSNTQDQILLQWKEGDSGTMHILVVHAMIILLTYGPPKCKYPFCNERVAL